MPAKSSFQKFLAKLVPSQEFAGLEISDKVIRFLLLSHYDLSVLDSMEIKLAPGIIVKGDLKKQGDFIVALEQLRGMFKGREKHKFPCIVTLPSSLFFFQVVELPEVADVSYDEAIRLNISQNSPIQPSSAYLDWQNLGVNLKTLQREFLVGMTGRGRIDVYLEAFQRAGFEPIALESRSLSLLRLFSYFSRTIEKNVTVLFIDIGQDGVSLVIGRQGKLYFDFFLYWVEIPEAVDGSITREDLEAILKREVLRIVEFASIHYSEGISHFVLFSPVLKPELTAFIQSQFSLKPIEMAITSLGALSPDLWVGAIGAGLRGSLVSRESDDLISLLPEGTENMYQGKRLNTFISLWGKIISFTLAGMLLVMGSVWGVSLRQKKNYEATLQSINTLPEMAQVKTLQQEAGAFNDQVIKLEKVQSLSLEWSRVLAPIVETAALHKVSLDQLSLNEGSLEIKIRGTAPSKQEAFDFSNALEGQKTLFSKAVLPFSSLVPTDGKVSFVLTLTMAGPLK